MKINSFEICNFRCYYEKSQVVFSGEKKLTLIYGSSGSGKSSLLQFFRWMFYDDADFGKNDDMPLFNLNAYNDCVSNQKNEIEVSGKIDFEHEGFSYRLKKTQKYCPNSILQNPIDAEMIFSECELLQRQKNTGGGILKRAGHLFLATF